MNKYLLLRDNKQSGPYTVPEIIAKGIKPYDLVWLEGKSAAWRYPSEIEELKAYAPAVEEQPYDRFYKKPEPEKEIPSRPEQKSRFEPLIVEEAISRKPAAVSKKVYINFPGGPKKVPVVHEPEKEQPAIPAMAHEPVSAPLAEAVASAPVRQSSYDKKLLYSIAAACAVLLVIISVLFVNYHNQRDNIRKLNDLVMQMEKRQSEDIRSKASPIDAVPASLPADTEQSQPVEASVSVNNNLNNEKPTATRHAQTSATVSDPDKPAIGDQQQLVGQVKIAPPQPKEPIIENLFNLVSVKSSKYKTGMLGGISNLRLELTNNSQRSLQKVAVEVRYFSPEKKVVKTQTVYFENIPAGSQPTVEVPRSPRGVSIDYSITDIKA